MRHETKQQENLVLQVKYAFDGVVLGEGVGLHETAVIDGCGSRTERQEARKTDEKHDWHKLLDDPWMKKTRRIGGISFFDSEGLRFHLPAYLCLLLAEPDSDMAANIIFNLTDFDDYNRERFSILNASQREIVGSVLEYVRLNARNLTEPVRSEIDRAIHNYWRHQHRREGV
jgi:hypothetical protein